MDNKTEVDQDFPAESEELPKTGEKQKQKG